MKQIITTILILTSLISFSQSNYFKEIKAFQDTLNLHYADTAQSPLTKEDLPTLNSIFFINNYE